MVDNASTDESVAMVRANYPDVKLIENQENVGFARANNQAMARATGRYFFLLNSDAELHAGTAAKLCAFLESHPTVGAVAPTLLNPDGSFQGTFAPFPTLWREFALITTLARWTVGPQRPYLRPKSQAPQLVDWITGAAFVLRREAYKQVGGLDESYFMYSEETDWCWRLRQVGWQIACLPSVTVMHIGGGSSAERSPKSYTQLYMSKLLYFHKVYGRRQAHLLRWLFLMVAAVRIGMWRILQLGQQTTKQRLLQDMQLFEQLRLYHVGV